MLSARLPSRLTRSAPLLACRSVSSFRSVFRVSPFFVSGGGAKGETGVEPVGKSGRGSSGVGCLLGRGRSVCSIVSVSGEISDVGRAISGHPLLLASCSFPSHPVRSCPLLFISCSSLPACSSRCGGPFLVPCVSSVGWCGGWLSLACPCPFGLAVRAMSCLFRPVPASRLFATGSGEAMMSGVSPCLLDLTTGGVDVRRPVPVPVAVRERSNEMRLGSVAWRHHRVPALLACRIVSPRSSTRGTGREAGRMMMSGSDMR